MTRSIFCILGLLIGLQMGATVSPPLFGGFAPIALASASEARVEDLEQALMLSDLLAAMQDEGRAYGQSLDKQFLNGSGGLSWQAEVDRIYDPARLLPLVDEELRRELNDRPTRLGTMIRFYRSDLGRRIVTLEVSARRALLQDAVEDTAHATLDRMEANGDARLGLLRNYVTQNDLVEMNVVSALNANVAFLRALSSASAAGAKIPEEEILAQVRGQEDDVRRETSRWVMSFASLAYAPLTDEEFGVYADFSRSESDIALNNALFAAFDRVSSQVSGDLGQAVGRWIAGTNL